MNRPTARRTTTRSTHLALLLSGLVLAAPAFNMGCTTETDDTESATPTQSASSESAATPEAEPEAPPWIGTWNVDTEASLEMLDDLNPALIDLTRSIYDGTVITLTEDRYAAVITVLGEERPFRFPMTATESTDGTWSLTVDTPEGPQEGTLSVVGDGGARLLTPEGAELVLIRSEQAVEAPDVEPETPEAPAD